MRGNIGIYGPRHKGEFGDEGKYQKIADDFTGPRRVKTTDFLKGDGDPIILNSEQSYKGVPVKIILPIKIIDPKLSSLSNPSIQSGRKNQKAE